MLRWLPFRWDVKDEAKFLTKRSKPKANDTTGEWRRVRKRTHSPRCVPRGIVCACVGRTARLSRSRRPALGREPQGREGRQGQRGHREMDGCRGRHDARREARRSTSLALAMPRPTWQSYCKKIGLEFFLSR